MLFTRRGKVN